MAFGTETAPGTVAVATDVDADHEWSAVTVFIERKSKCVLQ